MSIIGNNNKVNSSNEELLNAPYGMQGADIITNAEPHLHEPGWYCIMSIEDDTTLDASGCAINWNENGGNFTTDLDLITGVPYYGDFRGLELVDGKIIAYRK